MPNSVSVASGRSDDSWIVAWQSKVCADSSWDVEGSDEGGNMTLVTLTAPSAPGLG